MSTVSETRNETTPMVTHTSVLIRIPKHSSSLSHPCVRERLLNQQQEATSTFSESSKFSTQALHLELRCHHPGVLWRGLLPMLLKSSRENGIQWEVETNNKESNSNATPRNVSTTVKKEEPSLPFSPPRQPIPEPTTSTAATGAETDDSPEAFNPVSSPAPKPISKSEIWKNRVTARKKKQIKMKKQQEPQQVSTQCSESQKLELDPVQDSTVPANPSTEQIINSIDDSSNASKADELPLSPRKEKWRQRVLARKTKRDQRKGQAVSESTENNSSPESQAESHESLAIPIEKDERTNAEEETPMNPFPEIINSKEEIPREDAQDVCSQSDDGGVEEGAEKAIDTHIPDSRKKNRDQYTTHSTNTAQRTLLGLGLEDAVKKYQQTMCFRQLNNSETSELAEDDTDDEFFYERSVLLPLELPTNIGTGKMNVVVWIFPPLTPPSDLDRTPFSGIVSKIQRILAMQNGYNAWFSTLGGGYFGIKNLQKSLWLARQQKSLALWLGDSKMARQSTLNEAYNWMYSGRFPMARVVLDQLETDVQAAIQPHTAEDDQIFLQRCAAARVFLRRLRKLSQKGLGTYHRIVYHDEQRQSRTIRTKDEFHRFRIVSC